MTLTECEQLQKDIYSVLLRDLPSHIASFGNSTGTAIDQWVAVINNQATAMVRKMLFEHGEFLKTF